MNNIFYYLDNIYNATDIFSMENTSRKSYCGCCTAKALHFPKSNISTTFTFYILFCIPLK